MTGLQFVHLGADVIKVEPPDGCAVAARRPVRRRRRRPERSLAFWYYNGGKRSVVLDLDERRRPRWPRRACSPTPTCSSSPLHPARAATPRARPRRDRRGPPDADRRVDHAVRAHRAVGGLPVVATSSALADQRPADHVRLRRPLDPADPPRRRPGVPHRGQLRPHGVLLALLERQQTGARRARRRVDARGRGVTVELANPYWFYPRALVQRQTCRHAQPVPTQPAIFQCADGRWVYFALILADQKPWNALVEWMDSQDLAVDLTDPEYDDLAYRQAELRPRPGPRRVLLPAPGQLGRVPRGPATRAADRRPQRSGGPVRRRAPRRPRVLRSRSTNPGTATVRMPGAPYRFSTLSTVPPQPAASARRAHRRGARPTSGRRRERPRRLVDPTLFADE